MNNLHLYRVLERTSLKLLNARSHLLFNETCSNIYICILNPKKNCIQDSVLDFVHDFKNMTLVLNVDVERFLCSNNRMSTQIILIDYKKKTKCICNAHVLLQSSTQG